ncbi:hypothetical protein CEXT_558161 [Caerostris extrusa]|uniref:Uncharacterized protein n=1 Tax=Caerostris extrusa TaxID=172846 RepID=A0AAV4WB30_CAEEX|nr:hypothetical protein CEXT_558161 [Caerostris extrusa]
MQSRRALTRASLLRLAFEYESDMDYSSHAQIAIIAMDKECNVPKVKNNSNRDSASNRSRFGNSTCSPLGSPIP